MCFSYDFRLFSLFFVSRLMFAEEQQERVLKSFAWKIFYWIRASIHCAY